MLLAVLLSASAFAASHADQENQFTLEFDESWQQSVDPSLSVKFALSSKSKASSGRPFGRMQIRVGHLDKDIPLEKYINNNLKTASAAWNIKQEISVDGLGDENRLLTMERKIGRFSMLVQKLYVKALGNVYELDCSSGIKANDDIIKSCANIIQSFKLLP